MMMSDDWDNWVREFDCRQDVSTDTCVQLHFFELGVRKLPRLVQNVFRYSEFAHVVEECRRFDRLDQSLITNANLTCKPRRIKLYPPNVTMRDLVFHVDRHRQRLSS